MSPMEIGNKLLIFQNHCTVDDKAISILNFLCFELHEQM